MKFSLVIALAPKRPTEVLKSIEKLNYPKKDFEIIAIEGRNASINRNKGAAKSKGEIVAFIDDDAIVDKDLLKNAADFFKKHKEIGIVGGPQLTPEDDKGFARISGYALSSKFGGWKAANRYEGKKLNLKADGDSLTSANLFCRKEVVQKVKFDPALFPGEDPKFIEDARKKGFKVAYSPNLIVHHRRRPHIKQFIKQIFGYGKVGPFKESLSETLKKPFFLVPSIFLIYLILIIAFIISNPAIVLHIAGFSKQPTVLGSLLWPLIIYLWLDLLFSIFETTRNEHTSALVPLFFIFPLLHLSYGAGRIYGYIKKLVIGGNLH